MLFKKRCSHKYRIESKSNVLQLDSMGYPLRLCICICKKCGRCEHMWIDTSVEELKELDTGESVLLKWD